MSIDRFFPGTMVMYGVGATPWEPGPSPIPFVPATPGIIGPYEPVPVDQLQPPAWKVLEETKPIPMRLHCPECHELHIDEDELATKPHHTHACQHCGNVWRPALVPTVGVRFLPGFKNEEPSR